MTAVLKERSRSLQTSRCLFLNADYIPLATHPVSIKPSRQGIENYLKNKVDIIDDWGDVLRSPSITISIPKVVRLRSYVNIWGDPKFCRRSILLRDRYRCQYCGEQFVSSELTYDHVIPRSLGGKTVWDNIVTACIDCNAAKANTLPNYSGRKGVVRAGARMRPLKEPRQPSSAELLRAGLEFLPNDIKEDFADWIYWDAEFRPA